MNILVFCDEDLGVAGGGARQVVQFARAIAARGHELRIVAPRPSSDTKDDAAFIGVRGVWVRVPRLPDDQTSGPIWPARRSRCFGQCGERSQTSCCGSTPRARSLP